MGKIGDLFVKLGLKNDEFKRGMQQSKQEVESFREKSKAVTTAIKGFWVAIGATAFKVIADVIKGSQRWGDAWAVTVSKAKTAWNQFVTSLTNWDWEGFGQRMRDAMNAAGESTAAHDAEFEVQNALKIRKAAMREELEDLQIIARSTNNSYEQRLKAANDYLTKVKPLYDAEAELRKSIFLADTKEYLANAGLSNTQSNRDALVEFLTNIAPDGGLVSALEQYSRRNRGAKKYNFTSDMERLVNGLGQNYSAGQIGAFASLAEYYQGNNKGDISAQKVTDAITNYFAAAGAFKAETKRLQVLRNSFEGQMMEDVGEGTGTGNGLADVAAALANAEAISAERARENAEAVREWKAALEGLDDVIKQDQESLQSFLDMNQEGILDGLKQTTFELNELVAGAMTSAVNGFSDAVQTMFDSFFAAESLDGSALMSALLTPLCDTAKQMGEVMMTMAAGMIAVETSITNPYLLLAAGAALVAIGAAGKAALSSIAKGGTATTSTGTSTLSAATTSSAELTVYVKGTIKGSDILISGQNTMNEWNK